MGSKMTWKIFRYFVAQTAQISDPMMKAFCGNYQIVGELKDMDNYWMTTTLTIYQIGNIGLLLWV